MNQNDKEEYQKHYSPDGERIEYLMENPIFRCPFCKKELSSEGIICPCEVAPKYDADYEEWKNK